MVRNCWPTNLQRSASHSFSLCKGIMLPGYSCSKPHPSTGDPNQLICTFQEDLKIYSFSFKKDLFYLQLCIYLCVFQCRYSESRRHQVPKQEWQAATSCLMWAQVSLARASKLREPSHLLVINSHNQILYFS